MGGRHWHEDEVIGLLAWLDFCISHRINFQITILQHLKRVTRESVGDDVEYTWNGVNAKLFYGLVGAKNSTEELRQDIKMHGSRSIPKLSPARALAIKAAFIRYENSFLDLDGKIMPFLQDTTAQSTSVGERLKGQQRGELEFQGSSSDSSHENSATSSKTSNTVSSHVATQPDMNPKEEKSSRQDTSAVKNNCKPSSRIKTVQRKEQQDCRPTAGIGQTMEEQLRNELQQKATELARVRNEWEQETEQLHGQVVRLKEVELELKAENQHLILARQDRERVDRDYLEYDISQKNGQIWKLNNQLEKMRKLAVFAQHDPTIERTLKNEVIGQAMETMSSALDALSVGKVSRKPLTLPKIAEKSELGLLIQSLFGTGEGSGRETVQLKRCILKHGIDLLVKCLCVAAVRDWVFYSDFPQFAPEDFRLLGAYRESVIIHDGWDRLRNLEIAAYHQLIDTQHFRTVLMPKKALGVVGRFLRVVAPLIVPPQSKMYTKDIESWGQSGVADEDRRFRLKEIFEAALTLKATTVTTDQTFQFSLHPPGTSFNGRHGSLGNDEETWMVASFHVYRGEKQVSGNTMTDALVRRRNFVVKAEQQRKESTEYQKVLVMQRQDQEVFHGKQISKDACDDGKPIEAENQFGENDSTHMRLQHPVTCHGCDEQHWSIQSLIGHRKDNNVCGPQLEVGDVLQQMVTDAEKEQNERAQEQHMAPNQKISVSTENRDHFCFQQATIVTGIPQADHANATGKTGPRRLACSSGKVKCVIEDGVDKWNSCSQEGVDCVTNETKTSKSSRRAAIDPDYRETSEATEDESSENHEPDIDDGSRARVRSDSDSRGTASPSPEDPQWELPAVEPDTDGRYGCPICFKTYSSRTTLRRHWLIHPCCIRRGHHRVSAKFQAEQKCPCKDCEKELVRKDPGKNGNSSYEISPMASAAKDHCEDNVKQPPASAQRVKFTQTENQHGVSLRTDKVVEHKRKRSREDADGDWRPTAKVLRQSSV